MLNPFKAQLDDKKQNKIKKLSYLRFPIYDCDCWVGRVLRVLLNKNRDYPTGLRLILFKS